MSDLSQVSTEELLAEIARRCSFAQPTFDKYTCSACGMTFGPNECHICIRTPDATSVN
jgi:hypothetical protein